MVKEKATGRQCVCVFVCICVSASTAVFLLSPMINYLQLRQSETHMHRHLCTYTLPLFILFHPIRSCFTSPLPSFQLPLFFLSCNQMCVKYTCISKIASSSWQSKHTNTWTQFILHFKQQICLTVLCWNAKCSRTGCCWIFTSPRIHNYYEELSWSWL